MLCEILFVYALICDPTTTIPTDVDEEFLELTRKVAEKLEIYDRKEEYYTLFRLTFQFKMDIETIRERYQIIKDAPFISDSYRFPNYNSITFYLTFNRDYYKEIAKTLTFPWENWKEVTLEETLRLYDIWFQIRECVNERRTIFFRRKALKETKELLGENNYYHGIFPPPVPIWRFKELLESPKSK